MFDISGYQGTTGGVVVHRQPSMFRGPSQETAWMSWHWTNKDVEQEKSEIIDQLAGIIN